MIKDSTGDWGTAASQSSARFDIVAQFAKIERNCRLHARRVTSGSTHQRTARNFKTG
jgi:hypothetical protein